MREPCMSQTASTSAIGSGAAVCFAQQERIAATADPNSARVVGALPSREMSAVHASRPSASDGPSACTIEIQYELPGYRVMIRQAPSPQATASNRSVGVRATRQTNASIEPNTNDTCSTPPARIAGVGVRNTVAGRKASAATGPYTLLSTGPSVAG